jgi:hypothetical protein
VILMCLDEWYHFDLGFLREILVNNLQMLALGFRVIVLNATFNNISAISWRPVLVMEEARVPGENHRWLLSNYSLQSGPGGSMSYVVGSNNSYKPITNTAWVRAQLCK